MRNIEEATQTKIEFPASTITDATMMNQITIRGRKQDRVALAEDLIKQCAQEATRSMHEAKKEQEFAKRIKMKEIEDEVRREERKKTTSSNSGFFVSEEFSSSGSLDERPVQCMIM